MIASLPRLAALRILDGYQRFLSPLLPPSCRFHPSCSEYCAEAIRRHGFVKGTVLGLLRLVRCQPLSHGGFDPVC